MHDRVVSRDEEPYADYSILTPYGRRLQKTLKLRGWLPQADGSYLPVDLPGPPSFQAWTACWRVYRSLLFMLEYPQGINGVLANSVVSVAAMDEYIAHFDALQA